MSTWDIVGFDNSYLRPIFAAAIVYHAGAVSGQGNLNVLCVGNKGSSGTLVADSEVRQVFSQDDCDAAGQAGFEVTLMGRAALIANPNAKVYLAAVTEAAGGTAATVSLTFTGTWTASGSFVVRINGVSISTTIGASDTVNNVATNVAAAINASPNCPFTASAALGVVTLTSRQKGLRAKQYVIYQDVKLAPSGFASAIAGSSTVNTFGTQTGVFAGLAGGAGADTVTTMLTNLKAARYARMAWAHNDTTNAALIKTYLAAQAAVTVQFYNQAIYASNDTLGNVEALSQTTLNDPRSQVYAMRNSETHPSQIAAGWAAFRAATESLNPVPGYDGQPCPWCAPQAALTDSWIPSEENSLLNAGATPILTVNGAAVSSRAITSYCLNGAAQDTRCLDIGDAVFPDYLVLDLQNLYTSVFKANNLYNEDNPPAGGPEALANVATPDAWTGEVLRRYEVYRSNGWIQDTFSPMAQQAAAAGVPGAVYLPVTSSFNQTSKRIQSNAPFIVTRVMHQLALTARQTQNV